MDRRELIQWLVATTGIGALDTVAPDDLIERIIPGAGQAGVPAFVERMLSEWHTAEERAGILAGLEGLGNFVDRSEAEQVAQLTSIDQSNPSWFARLKYLTVYGYCTSEVGMRELELWPQPWRYDGCAPVTH
jgi:glucoside 3-dehydrogenase (cytochrome c) hitch-hiker subunit